MNPSPHRRIAIILEAHTKRHGDANSWFDPWSVVEKLLAHAGIDTRSCLITYLVDRYVDVQTLKWQGEEVQQGVQALAKTLTDYQPHFCLLLDRSGYLLRAFSGEKRGVDDWRGSVFLATHVAPGVKTMATYSPKRLTMEYALTGVVRFDLKRMSEELPTDTLDVPEDRIEIDLTHAELVARLRDIHEHNRHVATDIEGWPDYITCIGFATSPNDAFVVPFVRADGTSWWTEDEEVELWTWVERVLASPAVSKDCHNALYELFCLAWSYGIVIEGLVNDTMVMWFELFAEMEKSLGFVSSILTKQPWYKHERKATDDATQLRYNGKDCCRTFEIRQRMEGMLKPRQMEHYRFNVSLLVPLAYMSLRGIRYDAAEAKRRLEATQQLIYELQDEINREAAKAPERAALRAFYEALGEHIDAGLQACADGERGGDGAAVDARSDTKSVERDAAEVRLRALLPLLTDAFCQARRVEKQEVEEVSWQPMRWRKGKKAGGKWVKAGKRVTAQPEGSFRTTTQHESEWQDGDIAYQAHTKRVIRNVPVEVETLEDVQRYAKDSCADACRRAIRLLKSCKDDCTPARRGELSTLLGLHVKINATNEGGDAQWYLYTHCALPKQFQKEGNKLTTRLASDDEAIIKAYLKSGKDDARRDQRALRFLDMRRAITQTKFLQAKPDPDGRIRSSMNLVATPTCRMAMYGSPTGSSDLNLQTIGKGLRNLFLADEGCYIGQRDLSNSDAYTVAAYCAALGDPTMLDDLRAKIKPANVLARIYEVGPQVNQLTRDSLREECRKVDGEGWLYFACKRVLHGSNYGMGKVTMANQILTDSFKLLGKPIWLEPSACEAIQERAFFVRYPGVRRWHDWMDRELRGQGILVASTGFQRRVFGRKDEHNTLKELLAHFPQYFTTLAVKSTLVSPVGLPRQWTDPENRREDGSLRVEPLLLVHDSNVSQWRVEDTEFAKRKLAEWFQNEFNIAGLGLVIPASGTYGVNWKEQTETL